MDDRPILLRRLRPTWEAWKVLTVGRPIISTGLGAAPAPISFGDIDRYAKRFGPHDEADFEELLLLLRSLDAVYLECEAKRVKKDVDQKPKKGAAVGNRARKPR